MKTAGLPSGRLLSYGLDDLGRAVSMTGYVSSNSTAYIGSMAYRASGQPLKQDWLMTGALTGSINWDYNEFQQLNSTVYKSGNTAKWSTGVDYTITSGCAACNNGNVVGTSVTVGGATRTQSTIGKDR